MQLGHGILTVNDVAGYSWQAFRPRVVAAVAALLESHPDLSSIRVEQLQLRYIDARPFDFAESDIYGFLRARMGLSIAMPAPLRSEPDLAAHPMGFSWQTLSESRRPRGVATLTFSGGEKEGRPHLFWEIALVSSGADVPGDLPAQLDGWLDQAHGVLVNGIFWKLIEGELEEEFGVVHDDD